MWKKNVESLADAYRNTKSLEFFISIFRFNDKKVFFSINYIWTTQNQSKKIIYLIVMTISLTNTSAGKVFCKIIFRKFNIYKPQLNSRRDDSHPFFFVRLFFLWKLFSCTTNTIRRWFLKKNPLINSVSKIFLIWANTMYK